MISSTEGVDWTKFCDKLAKLTIKTNIVITFYILALTQIRRFSTKKHIQFHWQTKIILSIFLVGNQSNSFDSHSQMEGWWHDNINKKASNWQIVKQIKLFSDWCDKIITGLLGCLVRWVGRPTEGNSLRTELRDTADLHSWFKQLN